MIFIDKQWDILESCFKNEILVSVGEWRNW